MGKNDDIEKSILSSIIFNRDIELAKRVDIKIFNRENQKVLKAMRELNTTNDMVLRERISEELLIDIIAITPITNLNEYLNILKESYSKRELEKSLSDAIEQIKFKNKKVDKIIYEVMERLNEIEKRSISTSLKVKKFNQIEDKERAVITKDLIPFVVGTTSIIAGEGGIGKSSISLKIAIEYAYEERKNVLLWLSEDSLTETKRRFKTICQNERIDESDVVEYIDVTNKEPFPTIIRENREYITNSEFYKFKKEVLDKYKLVILDPLIAFLGVEENSNSETRQVLNKYNAITNEREDISIIFVHHTNKEGGVRGGSTIRDSVRLVYLMEKITKNRRRFKIEKDNYNIKKEINADHIEIDLY